MTRNRLSPRESRVGISNSPSSKSTKALRTASMASGISTRPKTVSLSTVLFMSCLSGASLMRDRGSLIAACGRLPARCVDSLQQARGYLRSRQYVAQRTTETSGEKVGMNGIAIAQPGEIVDLGRRRQEVHGGFRAHRVQIGGLRDVPADDLLQKHRVWHLDIRDDLQQQCRVPHREGRILGGLRTDDDGGLAAGGRTDSHSRYGASGPLHIYISGFHRKAGHLAPHGAAEVLVLVAMRIVAAQDALIAGGYDHAKDGILIAETVFVRRKSGQRRIGVIFDPRMVGDERKWRRRQDRPDRIRRQFDEDGKSEAIAFVRVVRGVEGGMQRDARDRFSTRSHVTVSFIFRVARPRSRSAQAGPVCSTGRWQRTNLPGWISRNAGTIVSHVPSDRRRLQRVWNTQPGGGFAGLGISPSSRIRSGPGASADGVVPSGRIRRSPQLAARAPLP